MASFARVNPVATTLNVEQVGPDISFFTVDYINTGVAASNGPNGVQQAVLRTIQTLHTIICTGPIIDSDSQQTFAIQGPLYTPNGGTTLQAAIQALGTVDGVDVSSATVTATKLGIFTAAAIAV
jgi:hypothetical protein